jgi:hypothetical protein
LDKRKDQIWKYDDFPVEMITLGMGMMLFYMEETPAFASQSGVSIAARQGGAAQRESFSCGWCRVGG